MPLAPRGIGPALAASGLVIWSALSIWGAWGPDDPRLAREAWDTAAYFYVGLPLMALAVGIAAYLAPRRVWRWPLWLVIGHQVGVAAFGIGMQSGLSLVILTPILAALLAALLWVPALIGALLARGWAEPFRA